MSVHVILPAAGLGTRMAHAAAPKQFLSLGGEPIVVHSVRAFLGLSGLATITLAVRAQEAGRAAEMVNKYLPPAANVRIVEGGDTRQQSVSKALTALSSASGNDIVLVHDAVRPLIDAAIIHRVLEAAQQSGAAIVGVPATDTVKQVERTAHGAIVTATIPRERVMLAQTPQAFRLEILRRIFAEAEADGFEGTDEASLAERAGIPVTVVAGSPQNLKVTQPGDLELAEFFFSQRN